MKFRLVQRINERWHVTEGDLQDVRKVFDGLGFLYRGDNFNPRQRMQLQGLPRFDGLRGPTWDGDAIRYEDIEAHRILGT